MAQNVEQIKRELIDSVADRLRERLPEDKQATAIPFARLFFTNAPPKDFVDRDIDALLRRGDEHLRFRRPASPRRGQGADLQSAGRGTRLAVRPHTVIEIVTDNMPFLVDSISRGDERHGGGAASAGPSGRGGRSATPRAGAWRWPKGAEYYPTAGGTLIEESIIYMEVSEETDPETLEEAAQELRKVLADVRAAVEDWRKMREKAQDIGGDLAEDVARAVADDLSAEAPRLPVLARRGPFHLPRLTANTASISGQSIPPWRSTRSPASAFCATRRRRCSTNCAASTACRRKWPPRSACRSR